MACAPIQTFKAPRMQTNAAWQSPLITFYAGSPRAAVEIAAWGINGVAAGAQGRRIALTTASGKLTFEGTTGLRINLSRTDMEALGVGEVVIELMRQSPDPVRPLVRLTAQNCSGVA